MNKSFISTLLLSCFLLAGQAPSAQADDSATLYLNGELNPAYTGKTARVLGEVTKTTKSSAGKEFFKVKLNLKGVKPIWISSFAPIVEGTLKIGGRYVFIGHVRTAKSLDASGQLEEFIQSPTLLIVRSIQSPK